MADGIDVSAEASTAQRLGYALAMRTPLDRALVMFATALLAITFVQSILWFNWAFDKAFDARPLWTAIARLGPHPKILAITSEPGLGHPLVRALQGTWVSRQQGLWVAAYVRNLRSGGPLDPHRNAALDAYAARERAMLIDAELEVHSGEGRGTEVVLSVPLAPRSR